MEIQGAGVIELEYFLLDYNGTMAQDGKIIDTVDERLIKNFTILEQEFQVTCRSHILIK